MDIIILKHLKNNHPMSGYDVIKYLHRKFHMLPSSGTVYSLLYALERQKLIEGRIDNGKRVYKLTSQGEKLLKNICTAKNNIQSFLSYIFSEAQIKDTK
jgi:DNA-binding PadR family transcriptional regulator